VESQRIKCKDQILTQHFIQQMYYTSATKIFKYLQQV